MNPLTIIFQIAVLIFSVVIHEVSHGLMAHSLGDDTAKRAGRLTLNPIPHLDFFGSFLLPLLLVISRVGIVFGYAKPVPYNPYNLNDRQYGPAKVAAAGPLSNFLIAIVFGITARFLPLESISKIAIVRDLFSGNFFTPDAALIGSSPLHFLYWAFAFIVLLNLVLAIFNLVPIPPLDGHWFILTFLSDRYYRFKRFIVQYGWFLLLIFLFFFFPIIGIPISFFFRLIMGV